MGSLELRGNVEYAEVISKDLAYGMILLVMSHLRMLRSAF